VTVAADRAAFEDAVHAQLVEHKIELVVLAGFMRILTEGFVNKWKGCVAATATATTPWSTHSLGHLPSA